MVCTPFFYIHITLLSCKALLNTAVSIMIASSERTICISLLDLKEETGGMWVVKLHTTLWKNIQGAKHWKTLPEFSERTWPEWRSPPCVHFETLAAIFILTHSHDSFACSSLFFILLHFHQFLSSAKWEAVVVVTTSISGSLSLSLFSCFAVPASLSAFLSFLWCDKYLFPHQSKGGWEVWWRGLEWFLRI